MNVDRVTNCKINEQRQDLMPWTWRVRSTGDVG
ncbi:hypothetical protein NC652_030926 [Populus alba x Populus x berolinensis]|uniref:Uncharacterized protein n=1 Tax=Populus alba x Populus x berolinensis TaxID=444605 RepID=A0AAD6LWV0_9ROSI|nr:hypothetical protein NC652_030926 [Populus alba x Populus x berolinensis]KAJ6974726.1 hypothetical protein NC653_030759 [Populus alba x Populus x berolinensis]